ncbi:hypothetical protein RC86_16875 [Pectobacterium brasiliense]|uniref:Uncharacterized protein n=2 Tax=Pectobacterium TaxID=122277 RepID=A0AAW3SPN5_9GAMM|nr:MULTISPECIES: hypothetical protein [Pectobacterium]KHS88677.1 hypothetical protein RC86_16875 [Pectobacterium brasiliense]MBA5203326.1 hypothetical protein [Pectobacterium aroidearum]MBN3343746.1 hypothetical protein [Pectobacterium brasiliense]URG47490.1 hypothetical protein IG609_011670 [Pectobacterium quasiaquaticum]
MTKEIERDISSIRQELTGSELDLSRHANRSLKYYVRGIYSDLVKWQFKRQYEKEESQSNLEFALCVIGFIGVLLAIIRSAGSDIDWVREHTLSFRLWGVALCSIFVGVSLERSSLVSSLWRFTVTKVLLSIVLSGLVIYARGQAGIYVNAVFHVDASALPITLLFTTGLMVFKLILPFIIVVSAIMFLVNFFFMAAWLKNKFGGGNSEQPLLQPVLCVLVSSVLLYHGWLWPSDQLSDTRVSEKIYLLAHALDFNDSHQCANVPADRPVVFLGNAQDAVLVAPYQLEDFDFATFFEASANVPHQFVRMRCEYKPAQTFPERW